MGPAPLKAIKDGEVFAGYDTGFVFSEVNADYVKWITKTDEFDDIVFQSKSVSVVMQVSFNLSFHFRLHGTRNICKNDTKKNAVVCSCCYSQLKPYLVLMQMYFFAKTKH